MTYEEAMKIGEWFLYKQCDLYTTIRATEYTDNDIWNATNIAFKALENAEKYRWHDLRKDPNDLPKQDGYFLCKVESKNYFSYRTMLYMPCECKSYDMNKWIDRNVYVFNNFIIAWKEIEPFEVEE